MSCGSESLQPVSEAIKRPDWHSWAICSVQASQPAQPSHRAKINHIRCASCYPLCGLTMPWCCLWHARRPKPLWLVRSLTPVGQRSVARWMPWEYNLIKPQVQSSCHLVDVMMVQCMWKEEGKGTHNDHRCTHYSVSVLSSSFVLWSYELWKVFFLVFCPSLSGPQTASFLLWSSLTVLQT